jgi:ferredoxin
VYAQFPYQNFYRRAPSANHKFCLAANPTIKEMEDYVKERVLYGVVCVDLDDTNVRNKARDAFSRCNTDLLTVRRRDIDA